MAAKAKDVGGLKLVTQEARDVEEQFRELYQRTNKQTGAKESDVEALGNLLRDNASEKLWERIPGPLSVARDFVLEHSPGLTPGVRACYREHLKAMRKDLAGESPSRVESLLAAHAALCWLRLAEVEILYTSRLSGQHSLDLGTYYEKRLTMAQRRFTRAVETLERVRMMRRRAQNAGAEEADRRRA